MIGSCLARSDALSLFVRYRFMMMFGMAGTGTGLIYYGVGEPIYHLGYNRYLARGYLSYDQISQEAINLSYYHWGIHAWLCYTVVGICLGVTSNRMGLPLTMRRCSESECKRESARAHAPER